MLQAAAGSSVAADASSQALAVANVPSRVVGRPEAMRWAKAAEKPAEAVTPGLAAATAAVAASALALVATRPGAGASPVVERPLEAAQAGGTPRAGAMPRVAAAKLPAGRSEAGRLPPPVVESAASQPAEGPLVAATPPVQAAASASAPAVATTPQQSAQAAARAAAERRPRLAAAGSTPTGTHLLSEAAAAFRQRMRPSGRRSSRSCSRTPRSPSSTPAVMCRCRRTARSRRCHPPPKSRDPGCTGICPPAQSAHPRARGGRTPWGATVVQAKARLLGPAAANWAAVRRLAAAAGGAHGEVAMPAAVAQPLVAESARAQGVAAPAATAEMRRVQAAASSAAAAIAPASGAAIAPAAPRLRGCTSLQAEAAAPAPARKPARRRSCSSRSSRWRRRSASRP